MSNQAEEAAEGKSQPRGRITMTITYDLPTSDVEMHEIYGPNVDTPLEAVEEDLRSLEGEEFSIFDLADRIVFVKAEVI